MYNVKSKKAEEFIDDYEIKETIDYACQNKSNKTLIDSIIKKAEECKGLSHREAMVLLECDLEEENQRLTKEENELIDQIGKIKKNKEEYEQKIKECQEKYLQRVENDKKMKEYQQIIDDATKEYTESQTTRQMADKEIMDINKNHDFKKEIKYLTQHLQRLKSEPNVDDQIKMKEDYVEKLTKDCGLVECDHQPEKYRLNQRIKELEEQKVLFQKNLNELNAKMAAPMFDEKKDDAFGSLF